MHKYFKILNISKKYLSQPRLLITFIIGVIAGIGYVEFDKTEWYTQNLETKDIKVCFTPPSGCGELIAREIYQAKSTIFMHAFSLTSEKIAIQLIEASKRGVKVAILIVLFF